MSRMCRTIIDGFADKRFGIIHVNTTLSDTGVLINGYRVIDPEQFRNYRALPLNHTDDENLRSLLPLLPFSPKFFATSNFSPHTSQLDLKHGLRSIQDDAIELALKAACPKGSEMSHYVQSGMKHTITPCAWWHY